MLSLMTSARSTGFHLLGPAPSRRGVALALLGLAGFAVLGSAPVGEVRGAFTFEPLTASAACTNGGDAAAPFTIPNGFSQSIIASEPDFPDVPDMITQNETGPEAGRFVYQTHETNNNGAVSVTDLATGVTRILGQRADWERLDGLVWSPAGTLLFAEEAGAAARRDPDFPAAVGGLVYEMDPVTGAAVARPALGAKSHEGMRFDPQGNLYSISENNPGYVFRFVPDRRGDYTSGQLYALKVVRPNGDRVGEAEWVALDRAAVQVDARAAATAAGATGYNRPEDVETATSTGNNAGGARVLYVAITGRPSDNRVIGIELRAPGGGADHETAYVYDYVKIGVNAPADFEMPDNLALDRSGNLFITEDPATAPGTHRGDDIWAATPPSGRSGAPAAAVLKFASLTDCQAEPTGIYFDLRGDRLFVHVQHRGGDGKDKTVTFTR